jgi:hypothetical protein
MHGAAAKEFIAPRPPLVEDPAAFDDRKLVTADEAPNSALRLACVPGGRRDAGK